MSHEDIEFLEVTKSCWKNHKTEEAGKLKVIFQSKDETDDDRFYVVVGYYYHNRSLGLSWRNFPKSGKVLTPLVVNEEIRGIILQGLLYDAIRSSKDDANNIIARDNIIEAIDFLNGG